MKTFQIYLLRASLMLSVTCILFLKVTAQVAFHKSDGANDFPDLIFSEIKGAPKLKKPVLVMAGATPAMGEGCGWAAPAAWDWNRDGKKDLLIGEFGSGREFDRSFGSFIRIYKNIGTDESPKFTDMIQYALPDQYDENSKGGALSVRQFCCMSFQPQFADLNGDGITDLYTGNYFGDVTWFRGTERGFLSGEKLEEVGTVKFPRKDPKNSRYWTYSAVSFGDFTADSLPDMVLGGNGLRICKNIGTKTMPKFGVREIILDSSGKPLWKGSANPYVVDWNQDGVLDILVASHYHNPGDTAISFFRGIKSEDGIKFERGVPLFIVKDNAKAFPGDYLSIYVTDWNNDGINDLLVGTKVVILNGAFNPKLSWEWHPLGSSDLGKVFSPGYYSPTTKIEIEQRIRNAEKLEDEIGIEEMKKRRKGPYKPGEGPTTYMLKDEIIKIYYGRREYETLIQKGYVYLMLGGK